MNLIEELALIGYADDGTPVTDGMHLDNGLGGALLLELAMTERIDVESDRVVVRDPSPAGHPMLDAALLRIAQDRPRKPKDWVAKLAKDTRGQVMAGLVAQGVVREEKGKVLLIFPRTRYPATHGVEPAAETDARQRMRAAVAGDGPVEPRTAALCALVAATGLDRKVFADLDRRRVKARLREISQGEWAATAVKKAIEQVQAAVMAAVTASTAATAATAGGS
ncbi:GPP34 family phosphoprotein [Actinoplanes sp. NPDC049265]|uniref:GOLPH3/VPS74 family protein n=1 Tax=Actinoplanes sp. NPDC049265 TaxID=3363902 RepID=UPI00371010B4